MAIKKLLNTGRLYLWQKYREEQKAKHPLKVLFWETSLNCNLNCLHCGSDCNKAKSQKRILKTDEIKKALKEIAEDFKTQKILLVASGGEPLVRPDLFFVMDYARNLGFQWGMVTNGELLTPDNIKKIKETGLCSISVSIDGLKDSHNWLRNKDIFDKVVENTQKLTKESFQMTEVITCINQRNFGELEDIYKLCLGLGIMAWRIFNIVPVGRAKNIKELFLTPSQFKKLLNFIIEKRKERKLKVSFCEEGFLGTDYEGRVRDMLYFCSAGINVGSILYDGAVSACPILPRNLIQGNIRENRFSDIWDNKFQAFRDSNWKKKGKCKDCESWDFCEGNSLHLWDFDEDETTKCHLELLSEK